LLKGCSFVSRPQFVDMWDCYIYQIIYKLFKYSSYTMYIYKCKILNVIWYDCWLIIRLIYTYYIHSVVVQDFVSGRVCRVNQYHYQSRYHHTMYVISLSNISIKTNFKQIARVELKCVQYFEGDNNSCMTSHYFSRSFTNVILTSRDD
jgi:hypothetical protein